MKKLLKMFSLIAVVCSCLFACVGCSIFKDDEKTTTNAQVEYAELAKERKIVREVINNTNTILNHVQGSETIVPTAEASQEYYVDEDLQLYITFIKEITNEKDFVPGKLYNAKIEEEEDGELYGCYLLMNAYCGEDNIVTLNAWQAYDKDVSSYDNSVFVSYDIYYNEQYKVTKTVKYYLDYESGFNGVSATLALNEFNYSLEGKIVSGNGWIQFDTYKYSRSIKVNEYCDEALTSNQEEDFNNAMKLIKERTYLFNFARPLSQEAQDKIFSDF